MSIRSTMRYRVACYCLIATCAITLVCSSTSSARAQFGGGMFRNPVVGGISIDAEGVVCQPHVQRRETLRRLMREALRQAPSEMNQPAKLRKISLRRLEAAITNALKDNPEKILPEEIRYLAGIQRIQYVFVYPEHHDIVLAGPGEGWEVDDQANVVGITTRRPVLQLDDLLVALRSVDAAREVGLSCSIDPTAEGRRSLQSYFARLRKGRGFNQALATQVEQALGPQQITLTGVPADSHFARVMVASDYRMKRLAMNFEVAPVRGLPSYLDLLKSGRGLAKNMMPRWWLACNYKPLAKSEDGLAWELRGRGVKAMTENDFISQDGSSKASGTRSGRAQRWADLMTQRYEQLSEKDLVFGELRNCMDLAVVAALLAKEDLLGRAGCRLPLLSDPDSHLRTQTWNSPKTVASQCSFVKKGRNWIVTASGGVQITSWEVADRTESDDEVGQLRQQAETGDRSRWWWN